MFPKWNHIYTFNFDNVIDFLVADKAKDYDFHYADSGSFKSSGKQGIGYLHNSIAQAQSFSDLIFTNYQYGNKIGNNDNHLYYPLLNDINGHKKDLIIIGSQFNEQQLYSYIFNEKRGVRKDLKIIHISYGKKPNYGYAAEKLLNDTNWVNCSAKSFLEFLRRNRHKTRNISIEGAIMINKIFIDSIHKGEKFTKSKFYSAKQDDNCQWYGIMNNFDVIRENYEIVKQEVLNAFVKAAISKVVAVIYGTGGCGKSTLLRRLALELAHEFKSKIIWVKDRQLENFIKNGLPGRRENCSNKNKFNA